MYLTIFGGKYSINSLHLLNISLLEKEGCIYICVCIYDQKTKTTWSNVKSSNGSLLAVYQIIKQQEFLFFVLNHFGQNVVS